ncbi:MAG: metal-dependent hydrolase [Candidatus Woesearchaeota archaeon]|nr:metal-dependent hydrolase [Candidatus Woesearchaeota archaeon]
MNMNKMMFKTHIAFGFLVGLLLIQLWSPNNQILFIMAVLLGSALPDIDHPESKVGKKVKIAGFLFEHRGFFHSIFAALILYLVLLSFSSFAVYSVYITGLVMGYLSHILIDAVTKEGIMPFHPLSRFRLNGFIRTGRVLEYIILAVLIAFDAWKLIKMY